MFFVVTLLDVLVVVVFVVRVFVSGGDDFGAAVLFSSVWLL